MTIHREPQGGFWTYDSEVEPHFLIPTASELREAWDKHHGVKKYIELDESMYGICEVPQSQPRAILSLDLCEVVRSTGTSVTRIYEHDDTRYLEDYGAYYGDAVLGEFAQQKRELLLPQLMHYDLVQPVRYSDAITAFLRRWREAGVFIVANTSTLPGCEISSIRFLANNYPTTTQGILLPRNHDGNGMVTKAAILQHVTQKITNATGFEISSLPIFAIEDAQHHAASYVRLNNSVEVIVPAFSWNASLDNESRITRVEQQFGTLDTFIATDEIMRSRGILI